MSFILGCQNLIQKYNMDETETKFLVDLYTECQKNHEYNCIIDDTIGEYEHISNCLVNYVNINHMDGLKNELKQALDPFKTDGWVGIPNHLYTDEELTEFQKIRDKQKLEVKKFIVDDEPSDPESD